MATADFTIADVLAWARTKPADERYVFVEAANCALGLFAREVRGLSESDAACQLYRSSVSDQLFEAAQGGPLGSIAQLEAQQTFGRFVERLERLCPETPVTRDNWSAIDAYLTDIEAVESVQA